MSFRTNNDIYNGLNKQGVTIMTNETNNNQTVNEKESNWVEYNSMLPFHDFVKNPLVVGRITDAYKINTKFGMTDVIVILDEAISLSNVALRGLDKHVGRFVRIEYLGEEKSTKTGFTVKKYDVRIKKEN